MENSRDSFLSLLTVTLTFHFRGTSPLDSERFDSLRDCEPWVLGELRGLRVRRGGALVGAPGPSDGKGSWGPLNLISV